MVKSGTYTRASKFSDSTLLNVSYTVIETKAMIEMMVPAEANVRNFVEDTNMNGDMAITPRVI